MIKPFFIPLANAPIAYYRMICFAQNMGRFKDVEPRYPDFDPENYNSAYEFQAEEALPRFEEAVKASDMVITQCIRDIKFGCMVKALGEIYKIPMIMETDDDPFSMDSDNPATSRMGAGTDVERAAYFQAKDADVIIVTNDYLKRTMYTYNENVHIIPNCIDFQLWNKVKIPEKKEGELVLGWAGAAGHKKNLDIVKPVFIELLEKYPNLIIKCLHGAVDMGIESDRFISYNEWVSVDKYPQRLANLGMDVAVAPLLDSEFNRSKSNLRYLQYSALKVPTVASNVGPYKNTIIDGENGYVANSDKIFLDKISNMLDNAKLRRFIGDNSHRFVMKNYNLEVVGRTYANLLKQIKCDYTRRMDVNIQRTTNEGTQ